MAKRCCVVHWHVPELSLLLVGYRRALRCLRHCHCVLPKRQMPRVALGETLWLCSLFFLLFVVKWSSVPGAMRHPRTGLCLRRGRGSCLGRCWQALSKRCPTAKPFGGANSCRFVGRDLQWILHPVVGQPAARLFLGCWGRSAIVPVDSMCFLDARAWLSIVAVVFLLRVSAGTERALCSLGWSERAGEAQGNVMVLAGP